MITDLFIHIHIPKTAGQLIRGVIFESKKHWKFFVENSHISLSEGLKILKENGYNKVPGFCFVRNPLDYYVSRYFHRQRMLYEEKSINENIPIERFGRNINAFQKHIIELNKIKESGGKVLDIDGNVAHTRTYQYITISEWYNHLTDPGADFVGKFENLAEDASEILNKIAPSVFNKEKIKKIVQNRKINTSKHKQFLEYYNIETKNIVKKWDKDYIEKFNY